MTAASGKSQTNVQQDANHKEMRMSGGRRDRAWWQL